MSKTDLQAIDYDEIKHETEAAWFVEIGGEDFWLPKSMCELEEEQSVIFIPLWLCEKKGIL